MNSNILKNENQIYIDVEVIQASPACLRNRVDNLDHANGKIDDVNGTPEVNFAFGGFSLLIVEIVFNGIHE